MHFVVIDSHGKLLRKFWNPELMEKFTQKLESQGGRVLISGETLKKYRAALQPFMKSGWNIFVDRLGEYVKKVGRKKLEKGSKEAKEEGKIAEHDHDQPFVDLACSVSTPVVIIAPEHDIRESYPVQKLESQGIRVMTLEQYLSDF